MHMVMIEIPKGKKSFDRLRLKWKEVIQRDLESLNGSPNCKTRVVDRENWKTSCVTGWFE